MTSRLVRLAIGGDASAGDLDSPAYRALDCKPARTTLPRGGWFAARICPRVATRYRSHGA